MGHRVLDRIRHHKGRIRRARQTRVRDGAQGGLYIESLTPGAATIICSTAQTHKAMNVWIMVRLADEEIGSSVRIAARAPAEEVATRIAALLDAIEGVVATTNDTRYITVAVAGNNLVEIRTTLWEDAVSNAP